MSNLFEEIEDKMNQLSKEELVELSIDIICNLQGMEFEKVYKEFKKDVVEHNSEYIKAQNNYNELDKVYNILCYELY